MEHLEKLCDEVAQLSEQTAAFIRKESQSFSKSDVELKDFNSLVSYVDKQAEQMIVKRLHELLPEAGFIAEEGTGEPVENGYNWIVDPLDGTTNFVHGIPVFSVSIALMHKNELLIGVVNEVNRHECFYAYKGGGAFCNQKPIKVTDTPKLSGGVIATGFPYADFKEISLYMNTLQRMMESSRGLRRLGSAAVDLAYVAAGRFDAFFEYNLNPWDVAAGALLVQEAGGKVTDFRNGDDFIFGKQILAGGNVQAEMLQILQEEFQIEV